MNRPDLFMCKWCVTCYWKALDKGYNFALDLISIEGFHIKLRPPKLREFQFREFRDSNLGILGQKWRLGARLVARHREYYKGGRWWLPPSLGRGEFYESVFARGLSMHQKCSIYALINLLFGLCRSMWVIDLLVTLPSPYPGTPTCPSTPEVLQAKEHTPTLHSFVMFTLDSHLSLSRGLGVRHNM
jgi:hypothetical protein